jgi:predicted ATPase/DNA-binding winged helix-turn-helix (wHTH) protein
MTANPAIWTIKSFAFGPFVLVPDRQLLTRSARPVRLGNRALDILTILVERPGELVTKQELMARAWPNTFVEESNLKVNMAALRRALYEGAGEQRYIETVIGSGYRFIAPVEMSNALQSMREPASSPQRDNLPTTTIRLVGRSEAVQTLRQDLEETRLVSIVGAGGIGKTSVALAVAEQAIGKAKDGVWLVDLSPLNDASLVPNAIATSIGMSAHSSDMVATLSLYLRERTMLLVLDSCEHVLDGVSATVGRILAEAPHVRILVTSREPLGMTGEHLHRLPSLGMPPDRAAMTAREALDFPSVQLFVERANDRLDAFRLTDADAPLVAEICRKLDGMALAIELAATRVDTFGVNGLLEQLDIGFRLLTGWRGGPERHRTLTAMLDWSYNLLAEEEAALLRAISVFASSFDAEDAAAVTGGHLSAVSDALAQLASKSLLAASIAGDALTYRLLDTTRAYASDQRQLSGEDAAICNAHAEHVCAVLERAAEEWNERPSQEWAADYGRWLDDLRSALDWAAEQKDSGALLIRLTAAGNVLWNHFSLTDESRRHLERAIAALDATGQRGTETELNLQIAYVGAVMFTLGLIPMVQEITHRALGIAEQLGGLEARLRCLRMIGLYELFVGQHDAAIETLNRFVAIAAADDPSAVAQGETHLAAGEMFVGRFHIARQRLEQLDEEHLPDLVDSRFVRFLYSKSVDVLSVLSHAQWLTGSPQTATHTAIKTVAYARETQHELSLTNALAWACPVFFLNGQYARADRYLRLFEDQTNRVGIVTWRPVAAFYRAALSCAQNDTPSDAIEDLGRAVADLRAINHWARMPFYLAIQAQYQGVAGHLNPAASTIDLALDLARTQNELWCLPEVMRVHAGILAELDRADDAEARLVQSMDVARQIGALAWQLRSGNDLVRLCRHTSRADSARKTLRPVYDTFTEGFATRDMITAADLLAGEP